MECIKCGAETNVADSRPKFFGTDSSVKRRRKCASCGEKFTTYEVTEDGFVMRQYHASRALGGIVELLEKAGIIESISDKEIGGELLQNKHKSIEPPIKACAAEAGSAVPLSPIHKPILQANSNIIRRVGSYHHTF